MTEETATAATTTPAPAPAKPYVCSSCGHVEGQEHEKGCIYRGKVTAL